MAWQLTSTSTIALIGDSITATFNGSNPWTAGFWPQLRAKFPAMGNPGASVRALPRFYLNAIAGRATGDISPTIGTILGALPVVTHVLYQLGINDAAAIAVSSLTIPTLQAQVTTLISAVTGLSYKPQLVWCGPWAHDSGDIVTQIAQVDTAISALVTAAGGTYITWSGIPNTGGNSQADGTHPTMQGAAALGAQTMLSVQVS